MRGTQATVGFHVPPLKTRPAAASAARSAAYCWKYGADIDWIKEPPPEGGHGFLLPVVDEGASVAVVFSAATEDGVATSLASSAATHLEGVGATLAPCDEAGVEPAEVHEEAGDAVAPPSIPSRRAHTSGPAKGNAPFISHQFVQEVTFSLGGAEAENERVLAVALTLFGEEE